LTRKLPGVFVRFSPLNGLVKQSLGAIIDANPNLFSLIIHIL
jgi:hypothetical protein